MKFVKIAKEVINFIIIIISLMNYQIYEVKVISKKFE